MNHPEEDDVALKIVHTADWHLGKRFGAFDEADRKKLTRARLAVVERIFGVAASNRVDAVLCAGDLFDGPRPEKRWWQGLLEILGRTPEERPIFLLPGNHDPLTSESVYAEAHLFRRGLPGHVHVVDHEDFEFPLGPEAVLYGVPCQSQAGELDLALRLPKRAPDDRRIRIGLVHGSTFDIEGCQTNFPIARDAAVRRGLDYLAIGDTHAFRCVPEDAEVPTVYPSTPEQTRFGEQDTGYVALVFFSRHGRRPRLRKERVAQWCWRQLSVRSLEDLKTLLHEDLSQTVLRLRLQMRLNLPEQLEADALLDVLKGSEVRSGRVGVLQVDRSGLELDTRDVETLFEEMPGVLQETVRRLRSQAEAGEKPEVAECALRHLYRLVRAGS